MIKHLSLIVILHFSIALLFKADAFPDEKAQYHRIASDRISELIKNFIIESAGSPKVTPGGETIYNSEMVRRFYERRSFQPAWSHDGNFSPQAGHLIDAIENAGNQGLFPGYYHLEKIMNLFSKIQDKTAPESSAELDLLLTDAFLMLGCHYSAGCIDPVTVQAKWFVNRNDLQVDLVLEDALKENSIQEALRDLLPSQNGYIKLQKSLIRYREIVAGGGWPAVAGKESLLRKGDEDSLVRELKKRLLISRDLNDFENDGGNVFSDEFERAVILFQQRHGLKPDGIIGPATLKAINVTAIERLQQIEVNLERMRWMSRNLGHHYILVNIADYNLDVIKYGQQIMSMEVVVGKPYWHTPVMSEKMRFIILNPAWNIPDSIAKKEIFPNVKKDLNYLDDQNIHVVTSWSDNAEEIDESTIDWDNMTYNKLSYKFRQLPGLLNPLGRIKFMFPNRFNVYLHDTPGRELFSKNHRAFSHGCIRIKRPIDLAEYLLQNDQEWTREKILAAIEEGRTTRVNLPQPINVHVVYLTAWVDNEDILQFRTDIYGRDELLDEALRNKPNRLSITMYN